MKRPDQEPRNAVRARLRRVGEIPRDQARLALVPAPHRPFPSHRGIRVEECATVLSGDSPLGCDEAPDRRHRPDAPVAEPHPAVHRGHDENGRVRQRRADPADRLGVSPLVAGTADSFHGALVRPVVQDDEVASAKREGLDPAGLVEEVQRVDRGAVRPDRVVDEAGTGGLQDDAVQRHLPVSPGTQRDARRAASGHRRELSGPALGSRGRDLLVGSAVERDEERAPPGSLAERHFRAVERPALSPDLAVRRGGGARERDEAEAVLPSVPRQEKRAHRRPALRFHPDPLVAVPAPRPGSEDESGSPVPQLRLENLTGLSRDQIAGEGRVPEMCDPYEGGGPLLLDGLEPLEETPELVRRVLDRNEGRQRGREAPARSRRRPWSGGLRLAVCGTRARDGDTCFVSPRERCARLAAEGSRRAGEVRSRNEPETFHPGCQVRNERAQEDEEHRGRGLREADRSGHFFLRT